MIPRFTDNDAEWVADLIAARLPASVCRVEDEGMSIGVQAQVIHEGMRHRKAVRFTLDTGDRKADKRHLAYYKSFDSHGDFLESFAGGAVAELNRWAEGIAA